jgi:hypothetical protein
MEYFIAYYLIAIIHFLVYRKRSYSMAHNDIFLSSVWPLTLLLELTGG